MMRTATCYEREIAGLKSLLTDRPFPSCKHRFDFRGSRIYAYAPDGSFLWSSTPTFAVAECIHMEAELATLRDQLAASHAACASLRESLRVRRKNYIELCAFVTGLDGACPPETDPLEVAERNRLDAAKFRAECAALRSALEGVAEHLPTKGECLDEASLNETGMGSYGMAVMRVHEALAKLNAAFGAGKEGGSR